MRPRRTIHPDLHLMRKTARKAAEREGYAQVIIQANDGSLSVNRSYPGCCPAWYGRIIEKLQIINTPSGTFIKKHSIESPRELPHSFYHEERSHT